ncbi:MAG: HAMP domain-containing histidine kinase [Candidatus Eremiobacteraeota bacterium]|nr:HAMP domain-containing histidine kinase [Candidatus Eremiobacteraeota bacterium]
MLLTVASLTRRLSARANECAVPLLVLRLPEFERIAWREGRPAARRLERATTAAVAKAAARSLRSGDLCAHDRLSDVYLVALCAKSRGDRTPAVADARATLERIAAAISLVRDLTIASGWTMVGGALSDGLEMHVRSALERGARDRERHDFFAAVGHELRTPLTSISGYLETLAHDRLDEATRGRFLRIARREAQRLERLLEGMFAFSLLDLSITPSGGPGCALRASLDAALDAVGPAARARHIEIERGPFTDVEAAIPSDACVQLLVNVLQNAVKYGREGGVIGVSVDCKGPFASICIDDDGPGIGSDEREAIFGMRVRGAIADDRPGSGVGLALARTMLRHVGGDIRAGDSSLGGARFEVTLPLAGRNR